MVTLGSLAAGLAHEINNPLSYIKAGASQLLGSVDELRSAAEAALTPSLSAAAMDALRGRIRETHGEATEVALELAEGSRRLERLAADLRMVTTPASGAPELTDPVDALDAAWTVIRSRFSSLPRYEVTAEPGVPLQSSHALVTQALLPILERAVVVAGPEGAVTVQLQQLPGGVEIRFSDTGSGIPKAAYARGEVPADWAWRSPTASPMVWEAIWRSRRLPGRAPPSASGCRACRAALFRGSCPASPGPR
jgi:signal transduction histidine kinase